MILAQSDVHLTKAAQMHVARLPQQPHSGGRARPTQGKRGGCLAREVRYMSMTKQVSIPLSLYRFISRSQDHTSELQQRNPGFLPWKSHSRGVGAMPSGAEAEGRAVVSAKLQRQSCR